MTSPVGLRLTGTRVAEYFRHGCERQLRWALAPEVAGVPEAERRPGTGLLAAAGRGWERRALRRLIRKVGEERVAIAGWTLGDNPRRLPCEAVVGALRAPGRLEVLVQPELRLPDPGAFALRYGLDPALVEIAPAVPDVIRLRRLRDGRLLFQVVDIKASAEARLSHCAQVAYYTLVLEAVCEAEGITAGEVDVRWGRVWSRDGRGPRRFPLAAYRHHVARMLGEEVARVSREAPADAGWHVGGRCGACPWLAHCRAEAERRDDLCLVPGITPAAKRALAAGGIHTVRALAKQAFRKETFRGSHALESQAERLKQRSQALAYGKLFDVERSTHLMPRSEDVRVVLTAEGDPVTGLCYSLGIGVESRIPLGEAAGRRVWIAEKGTPEAEREILEALLARLDEVLHAADGAGKGSATLHLYVYDRAELDLLRRLLLRQLATSRGGTAVARLLRFLSPATLTARADVARSTPGSVVAEVVSSLFALPLPFAYDLAGVSSRLQPSERAAVYDPPAGFGAPFGSQLAFERIHDVWRGRAFGEWGPEALRARIEALGEAKLAAIDSVVRAVRERAARRERLQLRKEPLRLSEPARPLGDPALETLRLFAELESAAEAVSLQALHLLPAAERSRRHEAIRGMHLVERKEDGSFVFEFDEECRDAKFRAGDFNLLLTNDDDRSLVEVLRQPWRRRRLQVELVEYDLAVSPPRVTLAPAGDFARAEAERWIDLDRVCVLDRAPSDFSTARIVATLEALADGHGEAETVRRLLHGEPPACGPFPLPPASAVARELLEPAASALGRPVLNPDQRRAWGAVFRRPVSVVWGPPGTGKTYLLAWMLLGLAAAARQAGRPLRVLVAAATHRAITNVLARLDAEMRAAAVAVPLRVVKLRGSGSEVDAELRDSGVEVLPDGRLPGLLAEAEETAVPLAVGSTVWSLWKQMRASSRAAWGGEAGAAPPIASWFDVIVVDEASQMKVGEALIALSSMRAGARVILCGDDRQLAPVVRGSYGGDAGSLFGSVFGHFARHFRRLPLRESRRMNAALVEYPRELFYPGLVSMVPGRRLLVGGPAGEDVEEDALLREAFLDPGDAVVLCTYAGVRGTARNPFEAGLAARLARLARPSLLDPATGAPYSDAAFAERAFAVLAPHRAQNAAILSEMRRLGMRPEETPVVDTVERMQGNEREMIVVSYAVADREYAEAEAEFLLDPNRFNVSVTRARAKLVVLVSEEVLDALPADEAVLSGSMALKGYVQHCRDAARDLVLPGPGGEPVRARLHCRRLPAPLPD
jgi:hypothetical protein